MSLAITVSCLVWVSGGLVGMYWWAEPRGYRLSECTMSQWIVSAAVGPALAMATWTDYYHLGGRCPTHCCGIKSTGTARREERLRELEESAEKALAAALAGESAFEERPAHRPHDEERRA